jgi:hypothetical protein
MRLSPVCSWAPNVAERVKGCKVNQGPSMKSVGCIRWDTVPRRGSRGSSRARKRLRGESPVDREARAGHETRSGPARYTTSAAISSAAP